MLVPSPSLLGTRDKFLYLAASAGATAACGFVVIVTLLHS
jgi:hypothetical protein